MWRKSAAVLQPLFVNLTRRASSSTAAAMFSAENFERALKDLNDMKLLRELFGDFIADGSGRQSAVLIPLCLHNGQPSILFNLRSNRLTRHKGYPCFPGGVADDGDKDSVHTALRETHEELGIEADNVKIIGTMPTFRMTRDKMEITAVIGDIGDIDSHALKINYDEVSVVFSRTINELCDAKNRGRTTFKGIKQGVLYSTPVFIADHYKIWGITAILLHFLLRSLVPDLYKRPTLPVTFGRLYKHKPVTKARNE